MPPPRCLWLAGDYPLPADSGLRAYSSALVEALARAGASVTALCLGPGETVPPPAHRQLGGTAWRFVDDQRRSRAGSVVSALPQLAYALATPRFRAALSRALEAPGWDAVVLDHLQMGWAASTIARVGERSGRRTPIVYVSHNHEASARRAIASQVRSPPRRLLLELDARKAARLERSVVDRAALVTAVTDDDRRGFASRNPDKPYLVLPPGYGGPKVEKRQITPDVPRRAVLVSSLHWHAKQANVEAFVEVADPLFHDAGAELVVVGPGPGGYLRGMRARARATTFTGWVDSLSEVLSSARMGVVSEPAGGGFKLKSLDYVFHRVPMAVLAGSAAGLPLHPGDEVLSFADEEALARGVLAAIDDLPLLNRLQERAYEKCSQAYEWSGRGQALAEAVAALRRS